MINDLLAPISARSEEKIRHYFKSGESAQATDPGKPSPEELAARFPPPDAATFQRWFPGVVLSRTACERPRKAGVA